MLATLTIVLIDEDVAVPVGTLVLMPEAQHVHHQVQQHSLLQARVPQTYQSHLSTAAWRDLCGLTVQLLLYSLEDHVLRGVIQHLVPIYPPDTSQAVELADDVMNQI